MINHLSYCGLVDARISASEKDLPVYVENVGDDANCQQDCYVAFFEWEFEATASVVNGEWVNFRKYRYLFLHLQNEILNMFSITYMKNAFMKKNSLKL